MIKRINMGDVAGEIVKLKNIIATNRVISSEVGKRLEELGYVKAKLGTGFTSRIASKDIMVLDIKSYKYLHGKFLCVGIASLKNGKGTIYRAYVKQIID